MSNEIEIIGQRLALFRKELSLSQKALANETGISRSYITNVETGAQSPSFDFLYKIINTYQISLDWLILGRGQMYVIGEEHILNKLNEEHIQCLEKLTKLSMEKQSRFLRAFNELLVDD